MYLKLDEKMIELQLVYFVDLMIRILQSSVKIQYYFSYGQPLREGEPLEEIVKSLIDST